MTESTSRFRELLQHLVAGDVRFVLVGGLAVGTWGYVRGTDDVDIVPDPEPENVTRLIDALNEISGRVVADDRVTDAGSLSIFLKAGDKAFVRTDFGMLDVLQGLPTVPRYADLEVEAVDAEYEGLTVRVCSLPHLLAMKRAAGRPMDLIDIDALEAGHAEKHPMDDD